jgi:hypothetical protein
LLTRRTFARLAGLALAAGATRTARSQAGFPSQPIRIMVGYPVVSTLLHGSCPSR